MSERLVEVLVPDSHAAPVHAIIEKANPLWSWSQSAAGTTIFKVLATAERVEPIMDALEPHLSHAPDSRLLVLSVEAISPRRDSEVEKRRALDYEALQSPEQVVSSGRISRSELYEDLHVFAKITPAFLVTTALSTIVAVVGIAQNNSAVTIGAMVIAPLLAPNMALALATTLGDMKLAVRALKANAAGFAVTLTVALLAGLVWVPDPLAGEVASRTVVSFNEILLALATGTAGALAVTTGISSSLVGVMVAVALLPPIVIASMLLVQGHPHQAAGAFLLLATNVICVNLSGVVTFYLQGVKPRTWWESKKSERATKIALAIWLGLLFLVGALIAVSSFGRAA